MYDINSLNKKKNKRLRAPWQELWDVGTAMARDLENRQGDMGIYQIQHMT